MPKPITAKIIRPGPARSRLEASTYVGFHPCPVCGSRVSPARTGAPGGGADGFWEVAADCAICGTVLRYIFDEGPGWQGGQARWGGKPRVSDPNGLTPVMAQSDERTALFSPDELLRLREQGRSTFEWLAESTDPKDTIPRALEALKMLRPMLELERFAATGEADLPDDHFELRSRLAGFAEAAGVEVPEPKAFRL